MTTSTFDSLAAMRGLEAAGVNRNQAEAHAEQLRAAAGADLEQLANKDDLKRVETTLTAEMRIVKWAMARTSRNSPSPRAPLPALRATRTAACLKRPVDLWTRPLTRTGPSPCGAVWTARGRRWGAAHRPPTLSGLATTGPTGPMTISSNRREEEFASLTAGWNGGAAPGPPPARGLLSDIGSLPKPQSSRSPTVELSSTTSRLNTYATVRRGMPTSSAIRCWVQPRARRRRIFASRSAVRRRRA